MQRTPRRPVVVAARAAVLLAMAAGSLGYSLADKSVSISDDGQVRTVHTFAGSIASALTRAGVTVGPHDLVLPALSTAVHDGSHIVIARGRPLDLTVDGAQRRVWVTQPDVAQAAAALGISLAGAYVSTAASTPIPRGGLAVTVRMPHRVTLDVGGLTRDRTTTAATVAGLLSEAGVALGPYDTVSEALSVYPADGSTLTVVRVSKVRWLQRTRIAVRTLKVPDPKLLVGKQQLAYQGKVGIRYRVWAITRHDGHVVSKTLVKDSTVRGKAKVIHYGTKPKPVVVQPGSASSNSSSSGSGSSSSSHHTSVPTTSKGSGLNWAALARCESGGNAHEVDGAYYGLYQFSLGTWRSVGGHGRPSDASASEQTYRAKLLYAQQGRAPWPSCGHLL